MEPFTKGLTSILTRCCIMQVVCRCMPVASSQNIFSTRKDQSSSTSTKLASAIRYGQIRADASRRFHGASGNSQIGFESGPLASYRLHSYLARRFVKVRSVLCSARCWAFFSDSGFNFETTGVRLEMVEQGNSYQFHGWYRATCADEKAEKEISSGKGASGFKSCLICSNCVNTDRKNTTANLIHYSDPDFSKFRQHTPGSYAAMADRLAETRSSRITKTKFEKMQTCQGVKYSPIGVLQDKRIRAIARIPESVYYDWQHCLVASGGVYQYQANLFIIALLRNSSVALEIIDEFAATIRHGCRAGKLSKTFFQDRVRMPTKGQCCTSFESLCLRDDYGH